MQAWKCPKCGQSNGVKFQACWNCGTWIDGSPPAPGFRRQDVPVAQQLARELSCLRCQQPMRSLGRMRFHEGSLAAPFLLGGLGELFVNQEDFEAFACTACGKVEFFLPERAASSA